VYRWLVMLMKEKDKANKYCKGGGRVLRRYRSEIDLR